MWVPPGGGIQQATGHVAQQVWPNRQTWDCHWYECSGCAGTGPCMVPSWEDVRVLRRTVLPGMSQPLLQAGQAAVKVV